jgi:hypothetical protein
MNFSEKGLLSDRWGRKKAGFFKNLCKIPRAVDHPGEDLSIFGGF